MKVICIGDSNTWGYDPRSYFGGRYEANCRWVDILAEKTGWEVINEGVNGMCIPRKTAFFSENADRWLIMLGTNDILQGDSAEDAASNMRLFLKCIPSDPQNILLAAPPVLRYGAWVSDEKQIEESGKLISFYRALSAEMGIGYVNTAEWELPISFDGVHFTEHAHIIFADRIKKYLVK